MKCIYCKSNCYRKGKRKGVQRYQCKQCKKYQQQNYTRPIISTDKYEWVKSLTCEGCGISSISRLLHITKSSVQRIIERIASKISIAEYNENNQQYEMDELKSYLGKKGNELWVMYAINKSSGQVIDFCVGRRTFLLLFCLIKKVEEKSSRQESHRTISSASPADVPSHEHHSRRFHLFSEA